MLLYHGSNVEVKNPLLFAPKRHSKLWNSLRVTRWNNGTRSC